MYFNQDSNRLSISYSSLAVRISRREEEREVTDRPQHVHIKAKLRRGKITRNTPLENFAQVRKLFGFFLLEAYETGNQSLQGE
jgi:hypothetical protein